MLYYSASDERKQEFYGRNSFKCPTALRPAVPLIYDGPQFSLAMNSKLAKSAEPIVKMSCGTSRTALFSEAGVEGETELPGQTYDGRPHVYANRFSARHNGRGNIIFFDCRAESFRAAQIVTPLGRAPFPQEPIQWTSDPDADANLTQ